MSQAYGRVYLYLFPKDEGTTEQKLCRAVSDYATRCQGLSGLDISNKLDIKRTERGKPYFPHLDLGVSVSHSEDLAVCAVSSVPVGVDIQHHRGLPNETEADTKQRLIKLARRFFHTDEGSFVEEDPLNRFFSMWTAKESYVKYTGTGIDDTFSQHSVLPADKTLSCGSRNLCWHGGGAYFVQTPVGDRCTLCVCCGVPFLVEWVKINN